MLIYPPCPDLLSFKSFVDNSVQLDKTVDPNIEIEDEDDLALLQKPNKGSEEPDLLNPNELSENGKFLNKLLSEVKDGKVRYILPMSSYTEETLLNTREHFNTLPDDVKKELVEKFQKMREDAQQKRQAEALQAKTKHEQLQSDLETELQKRGRTPRESARKTSSYNKLFSKKTKNLRKRRNCKAKLKKKNDNSFLRKKNKNSKNKRMQKRKLKKEKRLEEYRKSWRKIIKLKKHFRKTNS